MSDLQISGLRVGSWEVVVDTDGDIAFLHDHQVEIELFTRSQVDLDDLAALIAAVAKLKEQSR